VSAAATGQFCGRAQLASVQAYNDDPRTTKADALLMLKRAAAQLEAEEQEQS
jgi:hypothetical protein